MLQEGRNWIQVKYWKETWEAIKKALEVFESHFNYALFNEMKRVQLHRYMDVDNGGNFDRSKANLRLVITISGTLYGRTTISGMSKLQSAPPCLRLNSTMWYCWKQGRKCNGF